MFKPDNIGEVIAQRKLSTVGDLKGGVEVSVLLGKPRKLPDGSDFYCPFQVIGMGSDKIRCAYGVDAFQSIQLAMSVIGAYLNSLNESEGNKLRWEGDENGDLGFPLPSGGGTGGPDSTR